MDVVVIAAIFLFINGFKPGQNICRNLGLVKK